MYELVSRSTAIISRNVPLKGIRKLLSSKKCNLCPEGEEQKPTRRISVTYKGLGYTITLTENCCQRCTERLIANQWTGEW